MVKAIWNDTVIAKSDDTLMIEGNHYFPPDSVHQEYLNDSPKHTVCPWKGNASYYDIVVDGKVNNAGAWYYPNPKAGSPERVGQENDKGGPFDFSNYVAFWNGVEVVEE